MSFDNTDKLKKNLNLGAKFFTTKSSNHWNFWAVLGPVGLTWCFVILSLILFVSTKLLPDLFNILLFQYKLNVIIVLSNLKHSVPKKCSIQNLFIRKTFHVLFWANLWGLSYMGGTIDQIMPRGRSFTNAFSSDLNIMNLKIYHNHCGIYTWKLSPDQSVELWKDLSCL